jgi:hypothetical protein
MNEKTDYSPYDEPVPEAEKPRRRRIFWSVFGAAHAFWLYALLLAGIIVLVIYLTGGFGEGAE